MWGPVRKACEPTEEDTSLIFTGHEVLAFRSLIRCFVFMWLVYQEKLSSASSMFFIYAFLIQQIRESLRQGFFFLFFNEKVHTGKIGKIQNRYADSYLQNKSGL